jgi:hypothetical protein
LPAGTTPYSAILRWALDDDDIDSFVDTLVRRLASFDREVLAAAKAQINRFGLPTAAELQSSNDMIFPMLTWPSAQTRRADRCPESAAARGFGHPDPGVTNTSTKWGIRYGLYEEL